MTEIEKLRREHDALAAQVERLQLPRTVSGKDAEILRLRRELHRWAEWLPDEPSEGEAYGSDEAEMLTGNLEVELAGFSRRSVIVALRHHLEEVLWGDE